MYFLGSGTRGSGTQAIEYTALPRSQKDVIHWNEIFVGKLVPDFDLSADENDLIALLCYRISTSHFPPGLDIQLIHFSSNEPHPHALELIIQVCDVVIDHGAPSIPIDISGDTLILCIDYPQLNCCTEIQPFTGIKYWCRIPPMRHLHLSNPDRFSLDMYYIPPSSSSLIDSYTPLCPFKSLLLPHLNYGIEISTFISRGEPSPRDPSSFPHHTSTPSTPSNSFRNRLLDTIILYTIGPSHALDQRPFESFVFIVHRDRLLEFQLTYPSSISQLNNLNGRTSLYKRTQPTPLHILHPNPYPDPNKFTICWTEWGLKITQWFNYAQEIAEYL
ncbi:hypothetical protein BDQ17DRAFT_1546877 [Cyathus striatus]|nr:hypothetical protein BDQ17DRAFT_1546877 [Cyathus striatus]